MEEFFELLIYHSLCTLFNALKSIIKFKNNLITPKFDKIFFHGFNFFL